jgi:hypothetical protein
MIGLRETPNARPNPSGLLLEAGTAGKNPTAVLFRAVMLLRC